MKTLFKITVLAGLLVIASDPCFAMISLTSVSQQQAKEWGIELRSKANGPKEVWVELEFKAEGKFKDFDHVSLEIREGDKFLLGYAPLQEKRSSSGSITIRFLVNRAYLDNVTLSLVVGHPMNYAGYELRVKDWLLQSPDPGADQRR
jgi:hypothetical protein